ncbi:MAG: heparan-alpha-glucosaminide N-acetyltransferase [Ignavibacteria bacterium]|nr:MAG: heparan-alpha-glucosaminide N-acetyltransferase [Ignavibacteria bacterium]KAF0156896.1 MAG: heparan-alpha-glucosaminide N-acetyltransferase [Ignavibacteria bacterium]
MEKQSDRFLSLDIFRGLTIAGMILVNNPGDWGNIYPALEHAKWNGCTPTDLVFPFFLFIVGVAVTLSLSKRKEKGDNHNKLILQIFKRSVLIFLIGVALSGFPTYNFSTIRIPGVLQRIALVYFFASLIYLKTNWKTQTVLASSFLFVYWALITLIPIPGIGAPDLSQPTIIDKLTNKEIAPNLVAWIDNQILSGHLWRQTKIWDPEGLLSTLPAISTGLIGILLGTFLKGSLDSIQKTAWIFFFGNVGLMTGIIWDMYFPMNKALWTSSYVIFTAGMALNVFGMCYWLADVKKITWWTKSFVVYGMNAITVYVLSGVLSVMLSRISWINEAGIKVTVKSFLYNTFFTPYLTPINASLAWALFYVLFWLGIMWIFYKKKIFLKV